MKITICIGRSLTAMTRTLPPIHARGDPGRRGGPGGPNTAELRDGRRRLREPYPQGVAQEPRVVARRGNLRLAVEEPALFLADRPQLPGEAFATSLCVGRSAGGQKRRGAWRATRAAW